MTKEEYLRQVGRELRDLPWGKRKELVADLRGHLDEVPLDQLEPPARYAAELREAAGLGRGRGVVAFLRARRPRSLVLAALLLVIVALLATADAWVQSYQPLALGSVGVVPSGSHTGPAGETIATFRDGAPFEFGFSVRNDGGFTVRVVDVPFVDGFGPFSVRLFVSRPLPQGLIAAWPTKPFRSFDLKPGQERLVVLRGRFAHCGDNGPGTSTELDAMPVRFSFLWRTKTIWFRLTHPLVIQVPAGNRCA